MTLTTHPRYNVFKDWFAARLSAAGPLRGVFYRVAGPRYTTPQQIVDGVGAFKAGGRWNPPGVMNAVYFSQQAETALREANAHREYFGLPVWQGMPKVIVAVQLDVGSVLNLTDPSVEAALPEQFPNLLAEDWRAIMDRGDEATTQAMGRAAHGVGLAGLIVRSRVEQAGINVIVFPDHLTKSCELRVLEPDLLKMLGK